MRRCVLHHLAGLDQTKNTRIRNERGTWKENADVTNAFQSWCKSVGVRGFGHVRVASSSDFCRSLRTTRDFLPGDGLVVVPIEAGFNFLVVAREMYSTPNNFPLEMTWMNYNSCLPNMGNVSHADLVQAGWMTRINSMEDSPFTPFVKWVLSDNRGMQGVVQAVSRIKKETKSEAFDNLLSEFSVEACEEPQAFLDAMFTAMAAFAQRSIPLEQSAIMHFVDGTNFFKTKVGEMSVPTLLPLIDTVPQVCDSSSASCCKSTPSC